MSESWVVWVVISVLASLLGSRRKTPVEWQRAAAELGLSIQRGHPFHPRAIAGSIDGFHVRIDAIRKDRETITRILVDGMGRFPSDLFIGTEGFLSTLDKAFGGQDILTGDVRFDDGIRIRGSMLPVIALLD